MDVIPGAFADMITIATKLLMAGFAIVAVVLASRWLDARLGIPFKSAIVTISKSATATADYYRFRWLGLCIVIAACFF